MTNRTHNAPWDGVERRTPNSCRRKNANRRQSPERRQDSRLGGRAKRTFSAWVRSIISGRLGVDRRKGIERRIVERRRTDIQSLVTQEELDALLK